MAAKTSNGTGGGNASAGASWSGGVAPADGDTITVAVTDTINQDVNRIYGSKASGVGHAVTINGTNATTFGTFKVNSGITVTLRGVDTSSNTLMLINQYGLFQPLTGSTVLGDVASNMASVVLNKGRFEPQTGVTLSVPAANVSWALKTNSETAVPSSYDTGLNLVSLATASPQISGAGQTGLGASGAFPTGQTSGGSQGFYSFSGWPSNPATEVSVAFPATAAQIAAAVNAAGKYAVDYDTGIIYFYSTTPVSLSCGYNYFTLDKSSGNWKGWAIVSGNANGGNATTGNTCLIDGAAFKYMGGAFGNTPGIGNYATTAPVVLCGHRTLAASSDATTIAYVKNSTFNSCFKYVQLFQCTGTAIDPILVTGNTFNDASGSTFIDGINFWTTSSAYIKVDSNAVRHRGTFVDLSNIGADIAGLAVSNNTGTCGQGFVANATAAGGARTPFPYLNDPDASSQARPSTPDLYIGSNVANGVGENNNSIDSRFLNVSGTSGHPAIVELNDFSHCHRLGHLLGSYVTFRRNAFGMAYHHGFTGSVIDDTYCTDLRFEDNLFWCDRGAATTRSQSAAIQLGYNHRTVINNVVISGNTCDGWQYGLLDYADEVDNGSFSLAANVALVNNVIANGAYSQGVTTAGFRVANTHVLEADYNVTNGQATAYASGLTNNANATGFYSGTNKYNRLTSAQRNIPSVALFDASYTTAQAGRTLAYTVTALGSNHTLAWGGGTAVQLIAANGTSSGGGLRTVAISGNTTFATQLTGTISTSTSTTALTGSGTSFTTELQAGDYVRVINQSGSSDNIWYKVASVTTNTAAVLTAVALANWSGATACRHRADTRQNWLWVVSGTGAGQARAVTFASPNVAYAATVSAGGSGYSVGQYIQVTTGTTDKTGATVVLKVTAVSGGVITGLSVVSGGNYAIAPTNPASTTRLTGASGGGCTVNLTMAPGLLIVPDLATALDSTSVVAVVKSMVTLADSGGTNTVKAGIGMCDPPDPLGTVTLPTTSQSDTGITVAVNHSPTGSPNFAGTFPGGLPTGVAADYKVTAGSSAIDAGTADNAPSTDYFGTARPQGGAYDIGFFESIVAAFFSNIARRRHRRSTRI